jgi:hypothetical protein
MPKNKKENKKKKDSVKVQLQKLIAKNKKKFSNYCVRLRKYIIFSKDDNDWISPSGMKNYIMKDPLLDYFYLIEGKENKNPNNNCEVTFKEFLMRKGNDFEQCIIKLLKDKFKDDIDLTPICSHYTDIYNDKKYKETCERIMRGDPIIYQGVLHNPMNKTYGSPDIIIRSDWINKIVPDTLRDEEIFIKAPRLKSNYHYLIIDIKFKTLHLNADESGLINSDLIPFYKVQTICYTLALGYIQGYVPSKTFLLGRGYFSESKGIKIAYDSCFDKLGVINIYGSDFNSIKKMESALDWVRDLRKNGRKWKILPVPSRVELYPNMSNNYDDSFYQKKLELAEQLGEITQLWFCGPKNRDIGFENGITSWRDPKCSAKLLGHKGEILGPTVQKMIEFNRENKGDLKLISPDKLKKNTYDIINYDKNKNINIYLDCETLSNIFDDFNTLPNKGGLSLVTLIGCYYSHPQLKENNFEVFVTMEYSYEKEKIMLLKFTNWYNNLDPNYNKNVYHWSNADVHFLNEVYDRHKDITKPFFKFIDLLDIFKKEPILIKDAYDFSIKTIVRKLREHKLLNCEGWPDSCSNGNQAMIYMYNLYKIAQRENMPITSYQRCADVIDYNKMDCVFLEKILMFLRETYLRV